MSRTLVVILPQATHLLSCAIRPLKIACKQTESKFSRAGCVSVFLARTRPTHEMVAVELISRESLVMYCYWCRSKCFANLFTDKLDSSDDLTNHCEMTILHRI